MVKPSSRQASRPRDGCKSQQKVPSPQSSSMSSPLANRDQIKQFQGPSTLPGIINDLGVASTHTLPYDLAQHTSRDALTTCSCSGLPLRAQESFKICIFSQSSGYTAHPLPRHSLKVAGQTVTTHLRTPVDPRLCKQEDLKTLASLVSGPGNQAENGNPPPRKKI